MKKIKRNLLLLAMSLTMIISLVGCGAKEEVQENNTIRLGVMSAADSAPILLAQEKGYFEEEGVNLELEIFSNGATKQSSIQAGELDAAMLNLTKLNAPKTATLVPKLPLTIIITTCIRTGSTTKEIAKFLEHFPCFIYINEMPVRMQMLMEDKIDMAVLPEPLASNAQLKGLEKRVYGDPDDFTPNAIIFTDEFIKNNPKTVEGFHNAYNKAVEDIINNPDEAKDILISKLELNPEIKDLIVLPTYHKTRIPDEDYIKELEDWTENLQGSELNLDYNDLVIKDYISE